MQAVIDSAVAPVAQQAADKTSCVVVIDAIAQCRTRHARRAVRRDQPVPDLGDRRCRGRRQEHGVQLHRADRDCTRVAIGFAHHAIDVFRLGTDLPPIEPQQVLASLWQEIVQAGHQEMIPDHAWRASVHTGRVHS
jgi:hypothetical protein